MVFIFLSLPSKKMAVEIKKNSKTASQRCEKDITKAPNAYFQMFYFFPARSSFCWHFCAPSVLTSRADWHVYGFAYFSNASQKQWNVFIYSGIIMVSRLPTDDDDDDYKAANVTFRSFDIAMRSAIQLSIAANSIHFNCISLFFFFRIFNSFFFCFFNYFCF